MRRDQASGKKRRGTWSEELVFRRAADSAVDGVAIVDLERRIIYVNEARARAHGYTVEELIGRDVAELMVQHDEVPKIAEQVMRSGRWWGELGGLRKDGSTFPARQTITRVDDPEGNPIAMLSVTRDITQERASRENLERRTRQLAALTESTRRSAEVIAKNEETLRLVVEGTPDFFFYIHDAKGVFTYLSPSVEDITGHSVQDWMSHYTRFLTDNPINENVIRYTERTLENGTVTDSYPVEISHKNGSRIMLEVFERPMIEEGKVVGIRGVARDVTELRMAEEAQRAAKEEAERRVKGFYRDTILSVTDGKLVICDLEESCGLCAGPLFPKMLIEKPRDVGVARGEVRNAANKAGMEESQVENLVLCVGEAATNALKHAGRGVVCVSDVDGAMRATISDTGPGMDSLALPRLTLMKGYSSTKSLGMGYATMLGHCDRIYLSTGEGGTTVVIEVSKQPVEEPVQLANLPDLW